MAYSVKWWNSHSIENRVEWFPFQPFLNQLPKIPTQKLFFFFPLKKTTARALLPFAENEATTWALLHLQVFSIPIFSLSSLTSKTQTQICAQIQIPDLWLEAMGDDKTSSIVMANRERASHPCGWFPSWWGFFQTIFLFIFHSPPPSPRPRGISFLIFSVGAWSIFPFLFFCSVCLPRKFWEL